jgi:hypothetical protein
MEYKSKSKPVIHAKAPLAGDTPLSSGCSNLQKPHAAAAALLQPTRLNNEALNIPQTRRFSPTTHFQASHGPEVSSRPFQRNLRPPLVPPRYPQSSSLQRVWIDPQKGPWRPLFDPRICKREEGRTFLKPHGTLLNATILQSKPTTSSSAYDPAKDENRPSKQNPESSTIRCTKH